MKNLSLTKPLIALVATLFIVGCSKDSLEKRYISTQEAFAIGYQNLELVDNQYYLSLTKADAQKLNINDQDYQKMVDDIARSNKTISEWMEQPDTNIDLFDPRDIDASLITKGEEDSRTWEAKRTIRTFNDWGGTDRFDTIRYGVTQLYVYCYSTGFMQGFNISATTCGDAKYNAGVGPNGNWNTTIPLSCSGVPCTITFRTTNSFGGSGTFCY